MAFAPVDEPQVALAVVVENAGFGAQNAAPIARRVFDYVISGQYPSEEDIEAVQKGQATRPIGKPRTLADVEVTRAIQTFSVASEEARRLGGDVIPADWDAGGRAFAPAVSTWVPRGPVLAIAPFNFPLNLVAHKVAPALAVGAPVLVKPAPQAPGASQLLARIFEDAARDIASAAEPVRR